MPVRRRRGRPSSIYDIARNRTVRSWAKPIGKPQIAELPHQTLEEEKKRMGRSRIAERSVNQYAAARGEGFGPC